MASPSDAYIKGIRAKFSYWATWLPSADVRIGDIGIFRGGYFQRQTSLKELGVMFSDRQSHAPLDFRHASQSSVSTANHASANPIALPEVPIGHASLDIHFNSSGSFIFHAQGCIVHEIENLGPVGNQLVNLIQSNQWQHSWTLVVSTVKAESATILISNSGDSKMQLSAATSGVVSNLADIDAGLQIRSQAGDITHFVAVRGLSPLFKVARVKRSILDRLLGRKPRVLFRGAGSPSDQLEGGVLELVNETTSG
ncbi:MAG TPA: hypothetical protein VKB79_03330 [Bryobacteraceae bacterium]|nr:hypothetical protein [Bryobacteraceae bacterium]